MLSVEVGSRVWQRAFIVLIMFLGTVILLTFPQYGITSDEASHMSYGEDIVTWYWSGFKDHSVFEYKNTWLYGGVLDTVVHLAGQVLPFDVYDTRHLCNALVGLLGVVAAYFLGSLLGGSRAGFLALQATVERHAGLQQGRQLSREEHDVATFYPTAPGQRGTSLFVAVRGYEPTTDNLTAAATQRDDRNIHRDDCVELFIDPDRGSLKTYYHLIINSLGTISDKYQTGDSGWDRAWSPPFVIATRLEGDAWILEGEFPAAAFAVETIAPGDIWGFNIARVRIANASEYGQWVPTYGFSHRPDHFGLLIFD